MNTIETLGFHKNIKIVNGFKPHFRKGNDFLFLIGSDFWISKIVRISTAFKTHNGKVYGVISGHCPRAADKDWITSNLTLLKLNPLSVGKWREDGTDIEFLSISKL